MKISEVIISGFIFGIMARQCSSLATDAGGGLSDPDGVRKNSSSAGESGSGRTLSRKRRFVAFPLGSSFSVAACMTIGVLGNPNWQYLSLGLNWGLAYELPNSTWVLEHANGFGKKAETPEPVVKRRYRRDLYQRIELIIDRDDSSWEKMTSYLCNDLCNLCLKCAVCATVGVVGSPSYNYLSYGLNWGVAYDLPNETWVIQHLHGFGSRPEPLSISKRRNRRSLYRAIEDTIDSMGYNGRDCLLRALCESRQFFGKSEKLGLIPELLRTIFSLPKTRLYAREIQEYSDIELYNRAYFSDQDEDCEQKYSTCSFSLLELGMGRYSEPDTDYYGD